jgi:hypothetical protein
MSVFNREKEGEEPSEPVNVRWRERWRTKNIVKQWLWE